MRRRAPAKPANEVSTDFGAESGKATPGAPEPKPGRSPSSSTCEACRETIELGLARGRNAMATWQDLVDGHRFAAGYQSVNRFVHKLRGGPTPEARVVIVTAPGEEAQVPDQAPVSVQSCMRMPFANWLVLDNLPRRRAHAIRRKRL